MVTGMIPSVSGNLQEDVAMMLTILAQEKGVKKSYALSIALRDWFRKEYPDIFSRVLRAKGIQSAGLGITGDEDIKEK